MKINKIILTGILATAMMGTSFAAGHVEDSTAIVASKDHTPREIKVAELPQPVQKSLKDESCTAQRVFLLYKDDQPIYQVEGLKEGEQVILHFDANGKSVEE